MSLRPPRPPLTRRLPIVLAAGALAVATAVTPAVAADDPAQGGGQGSGQGNWSQQSGGDHGDSGQQSGNADQQSGSGHQQGDTGQQSGGGNGDSGHDTGSGSGSDQGGNGNHESGSGSNQGGNGNHESGTGQAGGHHGDQGQYRGRVTVKSLALRTAPNRGSQVIRYVHKGDVVSIFCKVPGDKVNGNPLWYLLTDGTWAWGPAAHIDNIGPAPRWC
ncbi:MULTISPECIES: SH3 domain-containing protein [Streptomyces]|uniref:SH3 domain-containing protein n=1 Tax=Streptomyces edwardsiae TaxID=3075527 RepID=A0ABU2PQH4_9ACTN|nr:SH3 domain-containing protein [Streptomyces sp. DSM 41636]MDT0394403.1 SH3 domain-containing protein [Streptomyces sp. DSM 41636]